MNKRTKALQISAVTKLIVADRDSIQGCPCCIFCGSPYANPEAHYHPRSQGGLGIPENIGTVCRTCHTDLDHSSKREYMLNLFKEYLKLHYENWNEEDLIYKKW